ncbi:carboxypeptidase regulatory-like domain-containing protein [Haliangium sp.]|uniref:carboxypeptidase regulatory-like domain-containing protein n=1 Tax=Haliangium sp. TaxID=2663208 RepID=UPI003D102F22
MTRRLLLLVAALAVVLIAVRWLWPAAPAPDTSPAVSATPVASASTQPTPEPAPAPPRRELHLLTADDDPPGALRLEGQVLDQDDLPVAGATVHLSSRPPRRVVSDDDGSFVFEGLIGREYELYARAGELTAGPLRHRLAADTDPAIVRLVAAGAIEVSVRGADTDAPVAGARVRVHAALPVEASTDGDGHARLDGLARGPHRLAVEAAGYAESVRIARAPAAGGAPVQVEVVLVPGVPVTGRVVDADGRPVAGARVVAAEAGDLLVLRDPAEEGVPTDPDGAFTVPALAPGRYRFYAQHPTYAPGETEPVEIRVGGRDDVEISLAPGGVLAGQVVTAEGTPAPWAAVHVRPDVQRAGGWSGAAIERQTVADEHGRFHLEGVTRAPVVVHAAAETTSTELVAVDLRAQARREDLELALTLDGVIAGIVVDEHGAAVAEAQVQAVVDIWRGGELGQLVARGPAHAVTDGDGRFRLTGIPEGAFRVGASRSGGRGWAGFGGVPGTPARTGDRNLRIVLATPGSVSGTLRFPDGDTPALASITVAGAARTSTTRGEFHLSELPPGRHDLTVRGPGFSDRVISGVEVQPGADTDLGALTVEPGRTITGRVVDDSGRPVPNADIIVARRLLSDGNKLTGSLGPGLDEQLGVRRSRSDGDGRFLLPGIGAGRLVLVAEHAEHGRSPAQTITPGRADLDLELRLAAFGAVEGVVTLGGEPTTAAVTIGSTTNPDHITMVRTGADGRFVADRLAAGRYKISASSGMLSASSAATAVDVGPGASTQVTLDIPQGDLTLTVQVAGEAGAEISAAQVFAISGQVTATTVAALNQLILSDEAATSYKMMFSFGGQPAVFSKLQAGPLSVCVVPIGGDLNDPAFAQRLQRHADALAVHCHTVDVTPGVTKKVYTATVPPMAPLPE